MKKLWIVALFMLTACGSGKTFVETPATAAYKFNSAQIFQGPGTVEPPAEITKAMWDAMGEELYKEKGFSQAPGLSIEISFIQFEEGDRLKRYVAGFTDWGASSLTVRAVFKDSTTGTTLATITSQGTISGGFFGGGQSNAVEKVAEQVANYAKQNFLQ